MLIPWSAGGAKIAVSLKRSHRCMLDDSDTKLLIHSNTTDGSTTLTDSSASGHSLTAVGDVQHDDAQYKFGTTAILFDGTGDAITTPIDSDFDFGIGNLTIDFWVRFVAVAADVCFFCFQEDADDWFAAWWDQSVTTFYVAAQNPSANVVARYYFTWSPVIDTWYHIAIVRNGNRLYVFVNGVNQTLTEHTAISTNDIGVDDGGTTDTLYIGGRAGFGYLNGWKDEWRVTKGKARWVSGFAPPWRAY